MPRKFASVPKYIGQRVQLMNLVFEMFMWPYIYEINIEILYFLTNIRFSFNIVTCSNPPSDYLFCLICLVFTVSYGFNRDIALRIYVILTETVYINVIFGIFRKFFQHNFILNKITCEFVILAL